jgi:hypothetical protein
MKVIFYTNDADFILVGICYLVHNFLSLDKLLAISTQNKIETDRIIVSLREDGIVHVHVKDRTVIDIECQLEMKDSYWKVVDEQSPFVFTAGDYIKLTKEAQKNAKEMEETVPVGASALIVNNIAQKMLADFYYKISPPKNPLKVFRDFDKGIEWLKALDIKKADR